MHMGDMLLHGQGFTSRALNECSSGPLRIGGCAPFLALALSHSTDFVSRSCEIGSVYEPHLVITIDHECTAMYLYSVFLLVLQVLLSDRCCCVARWFLCHGCSL